LLPTEVRIVTFYLSTELSTEEIYNPVGQNPSPAFIGASEVTSSGSTVRREDWLEQRMRQATVAETDEVTALLGHVYPVLALRFNLKIWPSCFQQFVAF
jgi:hypothetical protein